LCNVGERDKHTDNLDDCEFDYSLAEIGGPSGIIVDGFANITTYPQASSLYFSNQGNSTSGIPCGGTVGVGCAIKLTRAALN
jgi:hypothetical protein